MGDLINKGKKLAKKAWSDKPNLDSSAKLNSRSELESNGSVGIITTSLERQYSQLKPEKEEAISYAQAPENTPTQTQVKKEEEKKAPAKADKKDAEVEEKFPFSAWHKGTFPNSTESVSYHLAKHGKGRTASQYTQDASDFFNKNKESGAIVTLKDGTKGIKIQTKQIINGKTHRVGGYWTKDGELVTFWD